MKKYITRILIFVLLLSVVPATDVQAASKKKVYKAYYNYLVKKSNSGDLKKFTKYCLVNLDGDRIPELVGYHKDKDLAVDRYVICSYNGKKVVTKEFQDGVASSGGYRGLLTYIPNKGKIKHSYISSGSGSEYVEVYSLKKGVYKKTVDAGSEYRNGRHYRWGNTPVSKSTYDRKLNKAFNADRSKRFCDLKYISKTKMKKKLK